MIRQDYLLRMIEQAAQMIAELIRRRQNDDPTAAEEIEREGAERFLELQVPDLERWDARRLFQHVRGLGSPLELPLRVGLAVSLLEERGDWMKRQGRTQDGAALIAKAIEVLARARLEAALGDENLAEGDLPRVEVEQGARQWEELFG